MSGEIAGERGMLNCGLAPPLTFSFRCPMRWSDLIPTDSPNVRSCGRCQREVHRCHDVYEADIRAQQGECVAVPMRLVEAVLADEVGRGERLVVGGLKSSTWLRALWAGLPEE